MISIARSKTWSSVLVTITLLVTMASVAMAHPTIDVAAANWKFTPAKLSIPVGEPTTLRLTSTSGVHGIESPELGIAKTTIGSKFTLVTFTPKKAGTYVLHCAVVCGPGHSDMTLTVVVTP